MLIVFASNFMNHHQLPLCLALKKMNDSFYFIASEAIPYERLSMGYADMNEMYDFIIPAYKGEEHSKKAIDLCRRADVLIIGSAPEKYIQVRPKDKLIFRYSERPYKNYTKSKAFISEIIHHYRYLGYRRMYMLCASAYTVLDHYQFGMYKKKCFKWGYFPAVREHEILDVINNKSFNTTGTVLLLWVGRFIDWKHPEVAIETADMLKEMGYDFKLKMIGSGYMEQELLDKIKEKQLHDCVEIMGAMSPEKVRENMEVADILLFTSDKNEGWGAVLNEAMNSACAVIANSSIGSVPFLILPGDTGLVYKTEDKEAYFKSVRLLMENKSYREKIGEKAYSSLKEMWSPEVAAERLIGLISALSKQNDTPYNSGPCSKADYIMEGWN